MALDIASIAKELNFFLKEGFAGGIIRNFKATGIANVRDTKTFEETFSSTGSMGGLEELSATQTPPSTKLKAGHTVVVDKKRFGLSFDLTEEDQLRASDSSTKVNEWINRTKIRALSLANTKYYDEVVGLYNNAFTTTLSPDAVALCGQHLKLDNSDWFNNKLNGNPLLTEASLESLVTYGADFKDGAGNDLPITFNTFVVKTGSANAKFARQYLLENAMVPTQAGNINIYSSGINRVIEIPTLTETAWFAFDRNQPANSELGIPIDLAIIKPPEITVFDSQVNKSKIFSLTMFHGISAPKMPMNFAGSPGA